MDHIEAVVEIKKVISKDFIKRMRSFIDHRAKENLPVLAGENTNIRNVKGYQLGFENPTDVFYWNYIRLEIQNLLKQKAELQDQVDKYINKEIENGKDQASS